MKPIFASLFLCLCVHACDAQVNADSLFSEARKLAFEQKDYPAAIKLAKTALAAAPQYTDIIVFVARLYGWEHQNDSAHVYFEKALTQQPGHIDASAGLSDLEYWRKNYSAALMVLDKGLQFHPDSKELLVRKAQVLYAAGRYVEAREVISRATKIDPMDPDVVRLWLQIRSSLAVNRIGVNYSYVKSSNRFPDPWHFVSLEYARNNVATPLALRVNYANRFRQSGLQFEGEVYPRISKTFYTYFNAAYSADVGVFPRLRSGASIAANLPAEWEAEAGIRYIRFDSGSLIYTGYLGKYLGNFLLGARTYIGAGDAAASKSYALLARYYFGNKDYCALTAGYGISPDESVTNILLKNQSASKAWRAELSGRYSITPLNLLMFSAGWMKQTYNVGAIDHQYQFGIGYARRF